MSSEREREREREREMDADAIMEDAALQFPKIRLLKSDRYEMCSFFF